MIRDADGALQKQVGVLFEAGSLGGWGDGALLDRFAAGRDAASEAAFAALVERHGAMVLRVCRAALGDEHEAHDAFQAVFLVLARKARTVRIRDTIGPWLHGVAWRVSARARAAGMRRRRHERRAAEMAARSFEPKAGDDAESALHEEVRRLPEAFRAAVVLCDLEGLTTDGAAERLGVPVGTVRSRLYRGRDRLRGRLLRRGIAPAAVGAVVAVPASAVTMTVPSALIEATVRLAVGCAWAGAVPVRLAVLMHGGRHAMGIKGLAAVGVSLGLVAGVGGLAAQGPGDGPAPKAEAKGTDEVAKTVVERKTTEARPPDEAPGEDAKRLQGRWRVLSVRRDGPEPEGDHPLILGTYTFRGDAVDIASRDGGERGRLTFRIDPDAEPRAMLVAPAGPSDERPAWWIYAFDRSKLRIGFDGTTERPRRPKGFESGGPGHPTVVVEMIRDPEPATTTAAAPRPEPTPSPGIPEPAEPTLAASSAVEKLPTPAPEIPTAEVVKTTAPASEAAPTPAPFELPRVALPIEPAPAPWPARPDSAMPQPDTFPPPPRPAQGVPQPVEAPVNDIRRLQGTWTILAREENGVEAEPDPDSTFLIAGNAMVSVWRAKDRDPKEVTIEAETFTIDPKADPKRIELTATDPGRRSGVVHGIYRVDGPSLLLCIALDGKPAPTGFDTEPGSLHRLFVLRRKKPGRAPVSSPAPIPGLPPGAVSEVHPNQPLPAPAPSPRSLPTPSGAPIPASSGLPAPSTSTPAPAPRPDAAPSATPGTTEAGAGEIERRVPSPSTD